MKLEKKINIVVLILLVVFLVIVLCQQMFTKNVDIIDKQEEVVIEETESVGNAPEKQFLKEEELVVFLEENNYVKNDNLKIEDALANYEEALMFEKGENRIYCISYYSNSYAKNKISNYLSRRDINFEDTMNSYYNFHSVLFQEKEGKDIEISVVDNVIFIFEGTDSLNLKDFIITDK